MRILMVGASADSSTLDVEVGWFTGLTREGHEVYNYSLRNRLKLWAEFFGMTRPDDKNLDQFKVMEAASDCVLHEAVRWRAEMVLIISGCSFHPNAAAMCQRVGIPVVSIMTECPYNDKDMTDLASVSTILTVNERTSLPFFESLMDKDGQKALYLPTAYNANTHIPGPADENYASDVFFCGTGFDERTKLFEETNWEGIQFCLAGFWPTDAENEVIPTEKEKRLGQIKIGHSPTLARHLVAGLLDNEETIKWYRGAKIVLATHRNDARAESVGPRIYEAAALGVFQISDDCRPELAELFGDAIPTFRAGDPEHLAWTIRYWLSRPQERREKALEARERVLDHSYDNRVLQLMAAINELRAA